MRESAPNERSPSSTCRRSTPSPRSAASARGLAILAVERERLRAEFEPAVVGRGGRAQSAASSERLRGLPDVDHRPRPEPAHLPRGGATGGAAADDQHGRRGGIVERRRRRGRLVVATRQPVALVEEARARQEPDDRVDLARGRRLEEQRHCGRGATSALATRRASSVRARVSSSLGPAGAKLLEAELAAK